MRHIINLVENAQREFFHGSRNNMSVGTILTPQGEGYVAGSGMDEFERETHTKTERFIEQNRPANAVPRKNAVFLVTDPDEIDYAGGYDDFIYAVEPLGPVSRCNLNWYSELYLYCEAEDKDIDPAVASEMAQKYWNAAPKDGSDLYEYLTPKAKIIGVLDS